MVIYQLYEQYKILLLQLVRLLMNFMPVYCKYGQYVQYSCCNIGESHMRSTALPIIQGVQILVFSIHRNINTHVFPYTSYIQNLTPFYFVSSKVIMYWVSPIIGLAVILVSALTLVCLENVLKMIDTGELPNSSTTTS